MKKEQVLLVFILMWLPGLVISQSIINTKHNLSLSGPGSVKATTESEICIFCHTPHSSAPKAPLWNKNLNGQTYTLYNSSTLNAEPGQPDGNSILCLSCHDGTIALGSVISRDVPISMTNTMTAKGNLTTDLSDDHPISFVYDNALSTADGQIKSPAIVATRLDHNSKLQCTSCHDPHKEDNPKFLVASNLNSALCNLCHEKTYWTSSSHNTSSNTWNESGTNPWAHIDAPYSNVSQNACANCHDSHNANGKPRLLKYSAEEDNCFDCHNANVASTNIQAQFAKTYRHNVIGYSGVHDPAEAATVATKHVECQDCHNPHASNSSTAVAPFVSGFNQGVNGINQSGNEIVSASYTYEICYKCHADNSWVAAPALPRQIVQNNVRLEFSTSNPSFHPIVGPRNNPDVTANLISPNTGSTILYCTDCHADDNVNAPKGSHGSVYPQMLKFRYVTADYTSETAAAYELCYSCHNRFRITRGFNSWSWHRKHVVFENSPCSICHDPHGISSTQGNSINNSNSINFRTDIVSPVNGILKFEDTGNRRGNCTLRCHDYDHINTSYF